MILMINPRIYVRRVVFMCVESIGYEYTYENEYICEYMYEYEYIYEYIYAYEYEYI